MRIWDPPITLNTFLSSIDFFYIFPIRERHIFSRSESIRANVVRCPLGLPKLCSWVTVSYMYNCYSTRVFVKLFCFGCKRFMAKCVFSLHYYFQDEVAPSFELLTYSDLVSPATPILPEDVNYWTSFASKQETPTRQSDKRANNQGDLWPQHSFKVSGFKARCSSHISISHHISEC